MCQLRLMSTNIALIVAVAVLLGFCCWVAAAILVFGVDLLALIAMPCASWNWDRDAGSV